MTYKEQLESAVETVFGTTFDSRDGRIVPRTKEIANDEAVKLEATFLYADMAGSAKLAESCPWDTTAKIIRAFLDCATRVIRWYGGEIRSFDGDRVMGVFIGDTPNTNAVKCGREIFYATDQIIAPKAIKKFKSVREADIKIKCCVGIDVGMSRAVRAGIRDNNDLIWIGRAPSMAAKLSDIREYPYCVYIHKDVFNKIHDAQKKNAANQDIWEERTFKFSGENHLLYRTKWFLPP